MIADQRLSHGASGARSPKLAKPRAKPADPKRRLYWTLLCLGLAAGGLLARAIDVQVIRSQFYQDKGEARYVRSVSIPAYRGAILDRNGEPLAISTPVVTVWANPKTLLEAKLPLGPLADALALQEDKLRQDLTQFSEREFVYLRRQMSPQDAEIALALKYPGVNSEREFRRFYPAGEVMAHVLGFTNIDDVGQEGAELAFNDWLRGSAGQKKIIRDRVGNRIADVSQQMAAQPGKDLTLSIDRRIQYLAYRELSAAVKENGASSGSLVMIDIPTGEILAMVNQPSFNPNARDRGDLQILRNRAVTDVFEPGSVMKPFTVAAALESGKFTNKTLIDTQPGTMRLANFTIRDTRNYGVLDLGGIIMHSSNVGAAKVAQQLPSDQLHDVLKRFGFGSVSGSGFPGESPGYLPERNRWRDVEKAAIGYGYGLSVTPLQIASAYAALANGGRMRSPSLVKGAGIPDDAVMDPNIALAILGMMETVTSDQGTARIARIANYRVGGKTGTARKASGNGYDARYIGSFAGVAPLSNPRIACVVVINDPKGAAYYGGLVAAPVFSKVSAGALRLLNVTPDAPFSDTVVAKITPEMLDAAAEEVSEPVLR
jgi:cell division protein FtsI (penicillin-binding protein 3)